MRTITVKVGKMPGAVETFSIAEGTTLKELLEDVAEISYEGYSFIINDTRTDKTDALDGQLEDEDIVHLTKEIKGNYGITVRIGKFPGRMTEVALNGANTVADALEGADLDNTGYSIRVNDEAAELTTVLADGDTVHLTKEIKGN